MRVFRREDVFRVRITYDDGVALLFDVEEVALYFFLDADVAILAVELCANDIPLERAQDTVFRFGRAYPAWWTSTGAGRQLPAPGGVARRRRAPCSRSRTTSRSRAI